MVASTNSPAFVKHLPKESPVITTLFQLVSRVESHGAANAVRFEPGWKSSDRGVAACIAAYRPAYMNQTTARTLCAMSWGLVQIMGDNLYNMGLSVPLWDYVKDQAMQESFFNQFVKSRGIDYTLAEILGDTAKRNNFARRYNGSLDYAQKLIFEYNESGR